jgi:hypothetical protein
MGLLLQEVGPHEQHPRYAAEDDVHELHTRSDQLALNLYTPRGEASPAPSTIGGTTVSSKSIADFDSTYGVMKSLRTLRATGPDPDALDTARTTCSLRGAATRGFVTSERYFGGDAVESRFRRPLRRTANGGKLLHQPRLHV